MTRGNQRDLARKKAQKKGGSGKKSAEQTANVGTSLTERKQRDADRMRDKQKKAADKKDGEPAASTSKDGEPEASTSGGGASK